MLIADSVECFWMNTILENQKVSLWSAVLKIYFAGAIRGGRDDVAIYSEMIRYLGTFGDVLTEHVGDASLTIEGNDGPDDKYIYDRDIAWLNQCDLVVAEVTKPSLGVGYELGWAESHDKPILCLFRKDSLLRLSAMIAGSPVMQVVEYTNVEDAKKHIRKFLDKF
jgi:hypothetical protein